MRSKTLAAERSSPGSQRSPSAMYRSLRVGCWKTELIWEPEEVREASLGWTSPRTVHGPWTSSATAASDGFGKEPEAPGGLRCLRHLRRQNARGSPPHVGA